MGIIKKNIVRVMLTNIPFGSILLLPRGVGGMENGTRKDTKMFME